MHRPKRLLASPFLVTFSVAAAASSLAAACGGSTTSVGGSSGSSGVVINNPPPPECVSGARVGLACAPGATACPDPSGESSLTCIEGTWVNETPLPPPPPVPNQASCPETSPLDGASCTISGLVQCAFVDGCDQRPSTAPKDATFQCLNSAWKRTSTIYAAACPATAPAQGDSCAACVGRYPATCSYPSANAGCPDALATCDPNTLTWSFGVSSCNPPAVDAGGDGG